MSKLAFILVAAFVSGEAVHGATILNENFNELTAQLAVTSAAPCYDLIGSGRGTTTCASATFGPYAQTYTLAGGDTSSGIVADALVTVSSSSITTTNLVFSQRYAWQSWHHSGQRTRNQLSEFPTPEPSTLSLFIPALLGLSLLVRRQFPSRTK